MRLADLISTQLHWSWRWLLTWLLDRGVAVSLFGLGVQVTRSRGQPSFWRHGPKDGHRAGDTSCLSPCSFWAPFSPLNDQMWFLVLISSQTMGLEGPQGKAGSPSPWHQAGLNQPQVLRSELILDFWSCLLRAGVAGRCFMASLSGWDAWEEAFEKTAGLHCLSPAAPGRVPAMKQRVLKLKAIVAQGCQGDTGVPTGPATKAGRCMKGFFVPWCPPKVFGTSG